MASILEEIGADLKVLFGVNSFLQYGADFRRYSSISLPSAGPP